jgi:hypothetical protein
VATRCNSRRELGEFIVMVAAVEIVNHAGRPTCFDKAPLDIPSYSEDICGGAGVVPGRAWAALMSSLRDSESFDIAAVASLKVDVGNGLCSAAMGRVLTFHILPGRFSVPYPFRQIVFDPPVFIGNAAPHPLSSEVAIVRIT